MRLVLAPSDGLVSEWIVRVSLSLYRLDVLVKQKLTTSGCSNKKEGIRLERQRSFSKIDCNPSNDEKSNKSHDRLVRGKYLAGRLLNVMRGQGWNEDVLIIALRCSV